MTRVCGLSLQWLSLGCPSGTDSKRYSAELVTVHSHQHQLGAGSGTTQHAHPPSHIPFSRWSGCKLPWLPRTPWRPLCHTEWGNPKPSPSGRRHGGWMTTNVAYDEAGGLADGCVLDCAKTRPTSRNRRSPIQEGRQTYGPEAVRQWPPVQPVRCHV